MTDTAMFCVVSMIVIAIYDGIAVSIGGVPDSISKFMQRTAFKAPLFVFAFGFLAGHMFGYMEPTGVGVTHEILKAVHPGGIHLSAFLASLSSMILLVVHHIREE